MTGLLGTFGLYFPAPDLYDYGVSTTAAGELPVGRAYVTHGGERLDQVAHAAYGLQLGAVEALLLANPGVADYGLELPPLLAVLLPDLVAASSEDRAAALFGADDDEDVEAEVEAPGLVVHRVYTTFGGERLDQVAHAAYGLQLGAVEALLLANPGVADYGLELPAGVVLELPELVEATGAAATAASSRGEVALWG